MNASTVNNKGKTEKNKKVKAGPCIFPFRYKWKNHNECFPTEKGEICATEVNAKGTLVKYGYCTRKSRQKLRKTIKVPKRFRNTKVRTMKKIEVKSPKITLKIKAIAAKTPAKR